MHYGVPEGSYATDPDGACRLREFRAMVRALNGHGLRVIVDVVYNHTFAAGADGPQSVLDKIVPGYYHRYSEVRPATPPLPRRRMELQSSPTKARSLRKDHKGCKTIPQRGRFMLSRPALPFDFYRLPHLAAI